MLAPIVPSPIKPTFMPLSRLEWPSPGSRERAFCDYRFAKTSLAICAAVIAAGQPA
jgi:hypothetical protein